jgi:peptidyl-prolyl cis-trans isomerase C
MSIKYGKLTIAAVATALLLGSALFFTPAKAVQAAEPPAKPAAAAPAPTIKDPKGDPVVATVAGEDVKRSEVVAFINSLPEQLKQMPIDQLFPLARDQVINNKLISKKADAANLAADPEVVKALAQAKENIIRQVYLERQVDAKVTNTKLADAYKQLLDKVSNIQEVHARHILFPAEQKDKAEEAIKKLNNGGKWEDVSKEYASGPTGQSSGDLGYFSKDEMVPEFADAAFALDTGKYTKEPVKTQFGWHVIQVLDKRKKPEPDFEQVKPQLEAQLRQETLQNMVEEWAKEAKITRLDINGEPEKSADKGKKG